MKFLVRLASWMFTLRPIFIVTMRAGNMAAALRWKRLSALLFDVPLMTWRHQGFYFYTQFNFFSSFRFLLWFHLHIFYTDFFLNRFSFLHHRHTHTDMGEGKRDGEERRGRGTGETGRERRGSE